MFKLNEPLDVFIVINGEKAFIDMAFDNVIDALEGLEDNRLNDFDRVDFFLKVMLQNEDIVDRITPDKMPDILKNIMVKIQSESPKTQKTDINGDPMPIAQKESDRVISFEQDAEYIYSAFVQAYGIDLIEQQGQLHWNKFKALLNSLPEDTLMRQIMDIRKTNLSDIKDKDERNRIKLLKEQFKLKDSNENFGEGGE